MRPLRFSSGISVDVLNGSHLFLLSDADQVLMDNAPAAAVASAVDGTRSLAEVVGVAAAKVGPGPAFAAARRLMARQLLTDADPVTTGRDEYYEARGLTGAGSGLNGIRPVVYVATLDRPTEEVTAVAVAAEAAFHRAGLDATTAVTLDELSEAARTGATPVVIAEDYIHDDFPALNRAMRSAGTSWILAKP